MAVAFDVRQKQRAVIEFLVCENETVGNIHKRLLVCGEDTVDRSTAAGHKEPRAKVDMQTFEICRAAAGHSQRGWTPMLRG
jgi:hypothetical protein